MGREERKMEENLSEEGGKKGEIVSVKRDDKKRRRAQRNHLKGEKKTLKLLKAEKGVDIYFTVRGKPNIIKGREFISEEELARKKFFDIYFTVRGKRNIIKGKGVHFRGGIN